jgi:hypothetical protein
MFHYNTAMNKQPANGTHPKGRTTMVPKVKILLRDLHAGERRRRPLSYLSSHLILVRFSAGWQTPNIPGRKKRPWLTVRTSSETIGLTGKEAQDLHRHPVCVLGTPNRKSRARLRIDGDSLMEIHQKRIHQTINIAHRIHVWFIC